MTNLCVYAWLGIDKLKVNLSKGVCKHGAYFIYNLATNGLNFIFKFLISIIP